MGNAYGAKQRHMERCRYTGDPKPRATKTVMVFGRPTQVTFKRKGDKVVDQRGHAYDVRESGWQ